MWADAKELGLPLQEAAYTALLRVCVGDADSKDATAVLAAMRAADVKPKLRTCETLRFLTSSRRLCFSSCGSVVLALARSALAVCL